MLGKRTRGRKLWNNPRLLNCLRSNKSLLLCKRRLPQKPSRGRTLDKPNYKNNMFNLEYDHYGLGQPSDILNFYK